MNRDDYGFGQCGWDGNDHCGNAELLPSLRHPLDGRNLNGRPQFRLAFTNAGTLTGTITVDRIGGIQVDGASTITSIDHNATAQCGRQ